MKNQLHVKQFWLPLVAMLALLLVSLRRIDNSRWPIPSPKR